MILRMTASNESKARAIAGRLLSERLDRICATSGAEASGLAFVALEDGKPSFEHYVGRRFIHPSNSSQDLRVDAATRFRVASISKTFVGIACMMLVEEGLLDLEEDVSKYLASPLRNPAFPDKAITPAMLLSHTSSLRDGERYTLPLSYPLGEFFEPGKEGWEEGAHFAVPRPSEAHADRLAPGNYYCYCNLGFGVMGTVIERLSGQRFDLFMRDRVLKPMGIGGSFNVRLLSEQDLGHLAALYRRGEGENSWDPSGKWMAQVDDLRGIRPEQNPSDKELDSYVPGFNATWFSPQGGLRSSALEIARLAALLIGRGELDGRRMLSQASIDAMRRARWTFDRASMNADLGSGKSRCSGLALFKTNDASDEFGGNRLRQSGGICMEGHHADAYGLLGGMLVDMDKRNGFVYLIGGTGADPKTKPGRFSSYYYWQEEIHAAAVEFLYGTGE